MIIQPEVVFSGNIYILPDEKYLLIIGWVDQIHMHRVTENLIKNSFNFTAERGIWGTKDLLHNFASKNFWL